MKIGAGVALIITFGVLGIALGMVILIITDHDITGFIANIGVLLTAVAGFIAMLTNQKKQSEDIKTVKTNTNGTLSKLKADVDSLTLKLNTALGLLSPEHAQDVLETTLNRDQVNKIIKDNNID